MKKILFTLLGLIISVPIMTSAQNADVDPQGSSTCVTIQNNLRYRTTDAQTSGDVSALQDFLQDNGYLKASPSGYMGLLTVKGVKAFQSDNGISPTGYVGTLTRAKIQTVSCAGTAANASTNSTSNNQNGTTQTNGCASGAMYNSVTGQMCSNNSVNSNTSSVSQAQNKQAATITGIQSAGNPMGTVDANHKASIYGTGLGGVLTIKIGNQEPHIVTVMGTSDTYAEFTVPHRSQASVVSVVVTNSSGVASNYYQININPGNTGSSTNGCENGVVYSSTTGARCPDSNSSISDSLRNAKILVYNPATGSTLQVGKTYDITWSETPSDSNTVYTIRDYVNQSVVTTISRAQAGCSASDICKYSWTPTQVGLSNYLAISDYAHSVYGQSGTFSVVNNLEQSKIPVITSVNPARARGSERILINGSNFTADTVVNLSQNGRIVTTSTNPAVKQADGNQTGQLVYIMGYITAANLTPGNYMLNVSNSQGISNSVDFIFSGENTTSSVSY